MKIFEVILSNTLLNKALNWIIKNNSSNFFPYHNLYHLLTVTENCNEGANYYALPENEKIELLLAGLFHDVNYVLDRTWKDAQKIALAVEALYQFRKDISAIMATEVILWQNIEAIILATEFPHKDISYLPRSHQIIQDADLMQIFAPNAFVQVILGLSQETGISPHEMIKSQRDFLYHISWNTNWAKLIFEEKMKYVEEQLKVWEKM